MGLTAIVSNMTPSAIPTAGGSIFISVTLAFLLGYLDLLGAVEGVKKQHRMTIMATIIPLIVAFTVILIYQTLEVL